MISVTVRLFHQMKIMSVFVMISVRLAGWLSIRHVERLNIH